MRTDANRIAGRVNRRFSTWFFDAAPALTDNYQGARRFVRTEGGIEFSVGVFGFADASVVILRLQMRNGVRRLRAGVKSCRYASHRADSDYDGEDISNDDIPY